MQDSFFLQANHQYGYAYFLHKINSIGKTPEITVLIFLFHQVMHCNKLFKETKEFN